MPQLTEPLAITAARVVTPTAVLEHGTLVMESGRIREVLPAGRSPDGPASRLDLGDATLLPGFIDLHVHGGGGWRVGADTHLLGMREAPHRPLVELSRFLATTGVTGFLPTLSTAPAADMLNTVQAAAGLVGEDVPGASVLGTHLEGPYINALEKGAQRPELIRPPSREEFAPLLEAARGTRLYVTLAPEVEGALEFITWLAGEGVFVSAGHTDATEEQMQRAHEAGLAGVTHLFNAMRGVHHREPGAVGWALAHPTVWTELIGDGVHVNPTVMRLTLRARGADKVALVTDAGAFTGLPDGVYDEGYRVVTVAGGRCTLESGALAESVSPMSRNCLVLREEVGASWEEVASMTSLVPATMLGLRSRKGSLEPGKDADVAALGTDGEVLLTTVGGRIVHRASASAV